MLFRLEALAVFIVVMAFLFTQVLVPFMMDTRYLPMFRRRQRLIEKEIDSVNQQALEALLESELRDKQDALDRHRERFAKQQGKGDNNAA